MNRSAAAPGSQSVRSGDDPLCADAVRLQLSRMLESRTFSPAARMARFLEYVVESTLDGQSEALKETLIAMSVFDRPPDYNPKEDPVVRSEARRLRLKLQQYYESEGAQDAIRIVLPKGAYRPVFETITLPSVEPLPDPIAESPTHQMASPAPAKVKRRVFVWAAAVTGLIAATAGLIRWIDRGTPALPFPPPTVTPFTSYNSRALDAAVSPDSKRVAFSWDGGEANLGIYVGDVNGGPPVRMTKGLASDLHPSWSRDGSRLAFLRASPEGLDVVVIPAQGGPERKVTQIGPLEWVNWKSDPLLTEGYPGPVWSADGKSLFVTDTQGAPTGAPLWQVDLGTGKRKQVSHPTQLAHDFYPALSRDGRRIAFSRQRSAAVSDIFVANIDTGSETRVTDYGQDIRGLDWTADDKAIVFSSNRLGGYRLWTIRLDTLKPLPLSLQGNRITNPAFSPDGTFLLYTNTLFNVNIWSGDLAGKSPAVRLIASAGMNSSPAMGPNGQEIAWASDRSGFWEIWLANADGTSPEQFTHFGRDFGGRLLGAPQWSPNGRELAFDARLKEHAALILADIATGSVHVVDENADEERMPTWSRDGRYLYFSSDHDGVVRIWKRAAAGGPAVRMTTRRAYSSYESADGQTLYFLPALSEPGIYAVPTTGGAETLLPGTENFYVRRHWTVSESGIYFAGHEQSPLTILFYSFLTRRIQPVRQLDKPLFVDTTSLALDPKLPRLIFTQQDEERSDIMLARISR